MKECFRCHQSLSLSHFYRGKGMADGHLNKCKECTKQDVKANRLLRVDQYRAYDMERGTHTDPAYMAQYAKDFPKAHKARQKAQNAVRDGRLEKATQCTTCSSSSKLHAHHDDYDKPLDVRWLCVPCHRAWHDEHGEALNKS